MLMDEEEAKRYKGWEQQEEHGIPDDNDGKQLQICEAKATEGLVSWPFHSHELYCSRCDLRWPDYAVTPDGCKAHTHNQRMLNTFGCELEGRKCERCKVRLYTNESRPPHCVAMEHIKPARIPERYSDWKPLPSKPKKSDGEIVAEIMQEMAETFKQRNTTYGSNYKQVPKLVETLFPEGVPPELIMSDHWHLFELILVKLSRFAVSKLSHVDSIHDMAVYSAMIEMILTREERQK
jgi:hypothetical protein